MMVVVVKMVIVMVVVVLQVVFFWFRQKHITNLVLKNILCDGVMMMMMRVVMMMVVMMVGEYWIVYSLNWGLGEEGNSLMPLFFIDISFIYPPGPNNLQSARLQLPPSNTSIQSNERKRKEVASKERVKRPRTS